ncbi:MAG: hypothetical protein PHI31_17465 [Desulfuromonadaceae bacterium]|nr:hypothetical protein [Desulfuromonadaceae bacterium]
MRRSKVLSGGIDARSKTAGLTRKRLLISILILTTTAGCSINTSFVYKPGAPEVDTPKLPVKIAVLPLQDGTEDFTMRGSNFSGGYVNLSKSGLDYRLNAMQADRWGKSFADDLKSSGRFRSVRFIYDATEAAENEVIIAGTITKAYLSIQGGPVPSSLAVTLNARLGTQGKVFWEKSVAREESLEKGYGVGCGFSRQCAVDQCHTHYNNILRGVFFEARQDLVMTLEHSSASKDEQSSKSTVSESADRLIEQIMREK